MYCSLLVYFIYTLFFNDIYLSLKIFFYELIPLAYWILVSCFIWVYSDDLCCFSRAATNDYGSLNSNLGY